MNANKIINTIALVCVIAAIVIGFVESNGSDDFISGLGLGTMFALVWITWVRNL